MLRLRIIVAMAIAVAFLAMPVSAQTPAAGAALPSFAGIALGETLAAVHDRLGDPLSVVAQSSDQTIWRYLDRTGGIFIDVLSSRNVVRSITLIERFKNVEYTDPNGVAFGASAADVRARLGTPTRTSTNADDGSVDLWYLGKDTGWIYELYGDRVGFVQVLVRPDLPLAAGDDVALGDGSSEAQAIRPKGGLMQLPMWPEIYLSLHGCGSGGHWEKASDAKQTDGGRSYTVLQARCTSGDAARAFYFDLSGFLTDILSGASAGGNTVYVDVRDLATAAPAASPASANGGTSFSDAIVITASNESTGVKAEYDYLRAHPCGDGGAWKLQKQALVRDVGKPYDVLSVACTAGGATRDFYFDISSFFGKP